MIIALIIIGCVVAACIALGAASICMSSSCRQSWEDDEQCRILAEDNQARFVAASKSAVSFSH